jgi:hypothetical protein
MCSTFKFLAAAPWPSAWMGSGGTDGTPPHAAGLSPRPRAPGQTVQFVAIGVPVHDRRGGEFGR